jgi:hypothetical protein
MHFTPVTDQQRAELLDPSAQIPGYIVYDVARHPICWAWRDSEFYTSVLFTYGSPSRYLN